MTLRARADLVVVGAGPAGLQAAAAAAESGLRVTVIDAETGPGGQFWRHPAPSAEPGAVAPAEVAGLHHGLSGYAALAARLTGDPLIDYLPGHQVWAVQAATGFGFAVLGPDGREHAVTGTAAVLATGAHDLPLPFPGWDLPGVLTAGGAQSLLKGHAVTAGRRVLVAGTGPFLLPVATGLARFGARVLGVVDAARPTRWLRHPGAAAGAAGKLVEAAGYLKDLARYRIPMMHGQMVIGARGAGRVQAVSVAPVGPDGRPERGRAREYEVDLVAVGWGFVPRVELAVGFGAELGPDPNGLPAVLVDARQRTTVPGLYAAGEICGIGGSELAQVEGRIAGIAAAAAVSGTDRAAPAALLGRRRRLREFAAALAAVYPVPAGWIDTLEPDTVICRCEEVTAGRLRAAVETYGAVDARMAKLLVRPGMGWCQGRMCGYATSCLTAGGPAGIPVDRPVATPVPLGAIARGLDPN